MKFDVVGVLFISLAVLSTIVLPLVYKCPGTHMILI